MSAAGGKGARPKITVHYKPAELPAEKKPGTEFGFCHTHGLQEGYGQPELVLRCFSAGKSQALVDAIVDRILSKGQRLEEGTSYEGFLSVPISFQAVEQGGKKCLELVVFSEGAEEWVEADVMGQEIGKIDGLDDLVKISEGSVSAGVVLAHWGCGGQVK
jgi:hypothetical protein